MVNNLHANAGDTKNMGLTPGSGKSLGEGNDNLLQYSCLENPMNRGAWGATVHGAIKSWRRLRDSPGNLHRPALSIPGHRGQLPHESFNRVLSIRSS